MPLLVNPYRFASVAAWSPADLASLSSWYDPSDSGSRTLDGSLLFQALTNLEGTSVRDLIQGTSGNRPALSSSAMNGLDAMDFDGSADWIGHSSPNLYDAGTCTVAAVFKAAPQNDKHTIGEADTGGPGIYSILRTQNVDVNGAPDSYMQVDGGDVDYGGFSDGTVAFLESTPDTHIWLATDSGSTVIHYVDGHQSSSHAYTRGSTIATDVFTVGCLRFNGGTFTFFDGLIGEIVCCTAVLGSTDRQKLEGYLAHKWGASDELDAGHPYKSAAP